MFFSRCALSFFYLKKKFELGRGAGFVLIKICSGLLCDLLWADPDKDVNGWGENDRGVSFMFGPDVVTKFLNRHDLDLICRAHQVRQCTKLLI